MVTASSLPLRGRRRLGNTRRKMDWNGGNDSLAFLNDDDLVRFYVFDQVLVTTRPKNLQSRNLCTAWLPQSERHWQLTLRQVARPAFYHARHRRVRTRRERDLCADAIAIGLGAYQLDAQHIVLICVVVAQKACRTIVGG